MSRYQFYSYSSHERLRKFLQLQSNLPVFVRNKEANLCNLRSVYPRKLTCNAKIHPWKRRNIDPNHQFLGSKCWFSGEYPKSHKGFSLKFLWKVGWIHPSPSDTGTGRLCQKCIGRLAAMSSCFSHGVRNCTKDLQQMFIPSLCLSLLFGQCTL